MPRRGVKIAEPTGEVRVGTYLRVSTSRQAEADLSLPDQSRHLAEFCKSKGWRLVREFVEPGASAMDDNRPEFQRMIEMATEAARPFDVILVHSFSRFFRDSYYAEMYIRRLGKVGVRLVSATQELSDDPSHDVIRKVFSVFDEYQSRENAKHTSRAMKENARQGYYNGSPVALGYKAQAVDRHGHRVKKKLVVDAVEAESVKLIFRLYLTGDGNTGPLGFKALTSWLNERGYRTRGGSRFGVASIQRILRNPIYAGSYVFNKDKPPSEQVTVEVPVIIERSEFDAVQATIRQRSPRVTPPRFVTGPILLTGITFCATCGGAMTLGTGTSRNGKVHKYYRCCTSARQGASGCRGRAIPMAKLDTLVVDHLVIRLFQPDRLTAILVSAANRRAQDAAQINDRIMSLRAEVTATEEKLRRLYKMVSEGLTQIDEILQEHLATLKSERDRAKAALDRLKTPAASSANLDPAAIEQFGNLMQDSITSGSIEFRKAYIRSVVDRIEVDDEVIRIVGNKTTLERIASGDQATYPRVRSFERKWRERRDLNPRPPA